MNYVIELLESTNLELLLFCVFILLLVMGFAFWLFKAHTKNMADLARLENESKLLKHQYDTVMTNVVVDDAIDKLKEKNHDEM